MVCSTIFLVLVGQLHKKRVTNKEATMLAFLLPFF